MLEMTYDGFCTSIRAKEKQKKLNSKHVNEGIHL